MELALEIPLRHWDVFNQFCDFGYALAQLVLEDKEYAKVYKDYKGKLFLDNGFNELRRDIGIDSLLKACDLIEPTHVTALEALDSQQNLKNILKTVDEFKKRNLPYKIVGCFRGGKRDLDILMQVCDIVALPYDDFRGRSLSWYGGERFHFFGFKNIDEIKRYKPASLDTSVPIRAAQLGIDLTTRERRPQRLPDFDRYAVLSKDQLELAVYNVKAIKTAGNGVSE